jgi:hypothetical protein
MYVSINIAYVYKPTLLILELFKSYNMKIFQLNNIPSEEQTEVKILRLRFSRPVSNV